MYVYIYSVFFGLLKPHVISGTLFQYQKYVQPPASHIVTENPGIGEMGSAEWHNIHTSFEKSPIWWGHLHTHTHTHEQNGEFEKLRNESSPDILIMLCTPLSYKAAIRGLGKIAKSDC